MRLPRDTTILLALSWGTFTWSMPCRRRCSPWPVRGPGCSGELLGLCGITCVYSRTQNDKAFAFAATIPIWCRRPCGGSAGFSSFAGTTEPELLAWLRRILVRNLADQVKRNKAQVRNWQRQESLEEMLDRSCLAVQAALAKGISSPSAQASRREESLRLADALATLAPDYRDVIVMRHLQNLKFEEIAVRLGRSAGATRMLWTRALEKLHGEMKGTS